MLELQPSWHSSHASWSPLAVPGPPAATAAGTALTASLTTRTGARSPPSHPGAAAPCLLRARGEPSPGHGCWLQTGPSLCISLGQGAGHEPSSWSPRSSCCRQLQAVTRRKPAPAASGGLLFIQQRGLCYEIFSEDRLSLAVRSRLWLLWGDAFLPVPAPLRWAGGGARGGLGAKPCSLTAGGQLWLGCTGLVWGHRGWPGISEGKSGMEMGSLAEQEACTCRTCVDWAGMRQQRGASAVCFTRGLSLQGGHWQWWTLGSALGLLPFAHCALFSSRGVLFPPGCRYTAVSCTLCVSPELPWLCS